MHNEIGERVVRAMAERVFPGCVIGIVREDGERDVLPFGRFTYDGNSQEVQEDSVYDLASITKSIPTASLALSLEAEGKLRFDTPARSYLPQLKNDHGATIEDFLRYRVGGVRLSALKDKSADELLAHVYANGFAAAPGDSRYTNLPALLLGLIIERVSGMSLQDLAQTYFFDPLCMRSTTYFPDMGLRSSRIAPTEIDGTNDVCGFPHDESARVLAAAGRASGHAGLFSTVPDLLDFFEALLAGDYRHVSAGAIRGLGWQTSGAFFGARTGKRAFGKTGFTGTSCLLDPDRSIALVILSNRTYPKRPANGDAINAFRRDIADIVLS